MVAWRQVYEGSGRCSEQDKVDTDWVDQVEDVDHAVVLLDEEDQVAQYEEDQSYRAELGSVDKSPGGRDRKYSDDERSEEQPEQPPTEEDQGEGDGGDVNQIEVHGLIVVTVRQPPH